MSTPGPSSRISEERAPKYADAIALELGGLIDETRSPGPLMDCHLPENVVAAVLDVVRRTRLWRSERFDVARELFAHFADGLERGGTPEELIESFGSPVTSAHLIRRTRLRNRPLVWRAWRRTWQSAVASVPLICVLWAILAARFIAATPTVTFDLVQEFDNANRTIPEQERAWPLYRKGLTTLTLDERVTYRKVFQEGLSEGPASEHWPETKTFLAKHANTIAIFLEATNRPKLGFINRDPDNSAWLQNDGHDESYELNPPGPTALEILLPQAQELSATVARMFTGATHLAAERKDGQRCLRLLQAKLALAPHSSQAWPSRGCQTIANWIVGSTARHAARLVMEHPDLFDDEQLVSLWAGLAAAKLNNPDLRHYEAVIDDFLQKAYTDDGNGNGRFTLRGFQILRRMESWSQKQSLLTFAVPPGNKDQRTDAAEAATFQVLAAPVAALIADRKNMREEMLQLNRLLCKDPTKPSTTGRLTDSEYATEYRRLLDSTLLRLRYLPALILMPKPNERSQGWQFWAAMHRVQRDAALLVIAAERYRRQHGQFPATADELVPALLPTVPIDPYTGKPLRYSVKDGRPRVDSVGLVEDGD